MIGVNGGHPTHILFAQEKCADIEINAEDALKLPSIFLAGPTLRASRENSWRMSAMKFLQETSFEGLVVVPEYRAPDRVFDPLWDWDAQVEWEWKWLDLATVVLFWVPRDMATLPGMTTNVEFGHAIASRDTISRTWDQPVSVVYGRPALAPHTKYLDKLAARHKVYSWCSLRATCAAAVTLANELSQYGEKANRIGMRSA